MSTALSEHHALRWLTDNAFTTAELGRVGLEFEWIVVDPDQPLHRWAPSELDMLMALPAAMPAGGSISFEPGGQLELSTRPARSLRECVERAHTDITLLRETLGRAGLVLYGTGLDTRPARRVVHNPRYAALEANYDHFGSAGRTMMCNTASVQINVDAGDRSAGWRGYRRRWRVANGLGPLLTAMFANSPRSADATGRSCRQILRFRTDPSRTDPLPLTGEPAAEWASYALNARVVGIQQPGHTRWHAPAVDLTMAKWLRHQKPRPAGLADLRSHLLTVIPPVRPRGFLELRMIDAQAGDNWVVPAAVVHAILDHPPTADAAAALATTLPVPGDREYWITAARDGLRDPVLAHAGREVTAMTIRALPDLGLPGWADDVIHRFAERYTALARCPADDEDAHVGG